MSKVIGQRLKRDDAWGKVFGETKFPADLNYPGQVYAVVVRSPHASAKIRRIDLSKALSLPGVVTIATAQDLVNNSHGVLFRDQPVLAAEQVRMVGDPIVAVAAASMELARQAAKLVEIEYEVLEGVFDPEKAMLPGAPLVHPEAHSNSNVIYHLPVVRGDMAKGWSMAQAVVERNYSTPMIDHAFLQPEAILARVDERGHLVVQVATQYPHYDRGEIAHALGMKISQIQIKATAIGGSFGGREDLSLQIIAALLAKKTLRPVKMENNREESFYSHCKRHPMSMYCKTGADIDGKLVALEARIIGDAGAYASWSPNILRKAAVHITGPYEIPNVHIEAFAVLTNNPWTGAMRGFGAAQPVLAYESQMDLLAKELGISPLEIRQRNMFKAGSITATGQRLIGSVGLAECLKQVEPYLNKREEG